MPGIVGIIGKGSRGRHESDLKLMIDSDSGENLLRKSKLAVQFVNNHLACSWIEPMQGSSGKGRDGS